MFSTVGDTMSTVGGYYEHHRDILSTVGDILSTVGGFVSTVEEHLEYTQYRGMISRCTWGDIMSTVGGVHRGSTQITKDCIPHGTEHPHGTHDIPHGTQDIPLWYSSNHAMVLIKSPPWYSRYPPHLS